MLKNLKLKNSSLLLIGLLLIVVGVFVGVFQYLVERKNDAYSKINILLYESETPDEIGSEEDLNQKIEDEVGNDEPVEDPNEDPVEEKPQKPLEYDYIGILEIPKINLKRGFLSLNSKYNNVNYNITVINGSTFPDQSNNNLILASHSGNCSVCYFNKLYKVELGDVAYVYYNNIKYEYKVVDIYEVIKDGTVEIHRDGNKNVLTLITCTRYSNTKQTVYILELYNKSN